MLNSKSPLLYPRQSIDFVRMKKNLDKIIPPTASNNMAALYASSLVTLLKGGYGVAMLYPLVSVSFRKLSNSSAAASTPKATWFMRSFLAISFCNAVLFWAREGKKKKRLKRSSSPASYFIEGVCFPLFFFFYFHFKKNVKCVPVTLFI